MASALVWPRLCSFSFGDIPSSPMLNNFRIFASNLEQADAMVEDFFWVVSGENMEDCNTALMVLSLYRNELAKKVARELLEMI